MSILKKMKKQWYLLNKDNYEVIKQEKERQEIVKFFEAFKEVINIRHNQNEKI